MRCTTKAVSALLLTSPQVSGFILNRKFSASHGVSKNVVLANSYLDSLGRTAALETTSTAPPPEQESVSVEQSFVTATASAYNDMSVSSQAATTSNGMDAYEAQFRSLGSVPAAATLQEIPPDDVPVVLEEPFTEVHEIHQPTQVGIAGKNFQMEEMEDAETRMTSLLLHEDGTVSALLSDIPTCVRTTGLWGLNNNGEFNMKIDRTFSAGRKAISFTDLGEFEFSMERCYRGELAFVGNEMSVQGVVLNVDEMFGEAEVGYFSMIDTTNRSDDASFQDAPAGMTHQSVQR